MKTLLRLLTLTAAFCAVHSVQLSAATAEVGKAAPEFSGTDLNGRTVRLSDLKGKTVVLEWVNPECPFVKRHYDSGNMPSLQKEATADGVVWLQINSGASGEQGDYTVDKAKKWLGDKNAAATAYLRDSDGKIGKAFGAKTTPHMFVISPEGVLVYSGAIDDNRRTHEGANNYVRAAIASVKAGKPVAKSTSEPYGCGVKY
jgi:hypothetical protein